MPSAPLVRCRNFFSGSGSFCLFSLLPIFSSLFWFVFSSHALFSRFVSGGGGASISVPPEVVLVTVLVC
jgi:hypothetical protein